MTLLQARAEERRVRRLHLYDKTRAQVRIALHELIPDEKVVLFGSITRRGTFNDASDIDLALPREPARVSLERLISELGERLGRRVDVLFLPGCRFREKIVREGEVWMT